MIDATSDDIVLDGNLGIEEIDALDAALSEHPKGDGARLDLSKCTHLHSAAIQLIVRRRLAISNWPASSEWSEWLRAGVIS